MPRKKMTTTRRRTSTPARRTTTVRRRVSRKKGLSAKFTDATKPVIGGALGGAAASILEKQIGEIVPGFAGGTAIAGAIATAMFLPKQTHVAAGMAAIGAQKLLARTGLAESGASYSSMSALSPAGASDLLNAGGALYEDYSPLMEGAYTDGYSI